MAQNTISLLSNSELLKSMSSAARVRALELSLENSTERLLSHLHALVEKTTVPSVEKTVPKGLLRMASTRQARRITVLKNNGHEFKPTVAEDVSSHRVPRFRWA